MGTASAWDEPVQAPADCVGDLTMDEVALGQLRRAIFAQAGRAEHIPALLAALNATDWSAWQGDAGAHIAVCTECNRYVRLAEATALSELPWLGDNLYCFECAERVRAEHTFNCDVCGHEFHAPREPQPFKVCPECDSPAVTLALTSLWAQLQRARPAGVCHQGQRLHPCRGISGAVRLSRLPVVPDTASGTADGALARA